MIQQFVEAWNERKNELAKFFRNTPQSGYDSYETLVKLLFEKVINPSLVSHNEIPYNVENLHIINDGDYQGTQLFIIPHNTYQPDESDYVFTHNFYGSCSGCDTLMSISQYDSGLPSSDQVDEYMTLCLHLIQKFEPLIKS